MIRKSVNNLLKWTGREQEKKKNPAGEGTASSVLYVEPEKGRWKGTLQKSEERFVTAFQNSLDAVQIVRVDDGMYVEINKGFTAVTGYQADEVIGRTVAELDIWCDPGGWDRIVETTLRDLSVMNMEARYRDRLGQTRTGTVSAMTMNLKGVPHILTVIRDIDVLKKTEEALAVSEARFRELFNNMSNGVAVFRAVDDGRDFVIIDFNTAAERIEGVSRHEVVGRRVLDVFPSVESCGLLAVLRRVWETAVPEHYPVAIYREGALRVWKENYVYRLPSGEIIDVYDDVTRRKQAEDKLLAYQEQLRSLTSELSLAEERERRRIATDLHDHIGQTLSVIKMKLFEVQEQCEDPGLSKPLEAAMDLLRMTIQDTRSLTFELSPPMLYELGLEAALEWLAETFQNQHGLICSFVDDGREKPLPEDLRVVLFRSVRELLVNVTKHAQVREISLDVRREEDRIKITVADRGVGFDPREISERSTRCHEFGLFNVRERLERLGGRLELHSAPGCGTTVTVSAPLAGSS